MQNDAIRIQRIIDQWRRLGAHEVTAEVRIRIEDMLHASTGFSNEQFTYVYTRIRSLTKFIERVVRESAIDKRESLMRVFKLLADLTSLLEGRGYKEILDPLADKLTTSCKIEHAGGSLELIRDDEFDAFFTGLDQFEDGMLPEDFRARVSVLVPVIVMACSRGALLAGAKALDLLKSEQVPLELLVEQMDALRKARQVEYTPVTSHGYRVAANALGYAIVKKYVQFPENWDEVVRRLSCESPDILRPLPLSVKNALRQGGPDEWPDVAVSHAEALLELFGYLREYAMIAVGSGGDDWDRIAGFMERVSKGAQALIEDIKPCSSCGGSGGSDDDCCSFCGGSGKHKDFRVPIE